MLKQRANNESGLTLIELLVTISISTMVVGLLGSILLSTFNHSQQSKAHINLRQEGNYLITQLKQVHGRENYTLCYEGDTLFFNGRPMETLAHEGVHIRGIDEEASLFEHDGSTLKSDGTTTCDNPLVVDGEKELHVSLTLSDDYDRELDVQTVIDRLADLEMDSESP
ncbi:PulJ/GspJ family protein [Salipaludibacillus daqingensis]|uniref:PulJ/GspJ family protein n=1 Tax=Salipaludibacillus daqingensis TaxID=3041001 RepID=UPI002473E3AA|nr:type II secretion system protein [Salipaludibacillus daqingensis]